MWWLLSYLVLGLEEAKQEFMLTAPCARCQRLKIHCTRLINCNNCKERHGCTISEQEWTSRARMVYRNINEGLYFHCDIIKYQIYLQASILNLRSGIKSTEARDIYQRLVQKYGDQKGTYKSFDVESLPPLFKDMISSCKLFKVEWMFNGSYKIHGSELYKREIMSGETIISIARLSRLPYKLVDFSNTNSLDLYYKLWVESVFTPMTVVQMKVGVFLMEKTEVQWMNMKVVTMINTYDSMITLTCLHPEKKYVLS